MSLILSTNKKTSFNETLDALLKYGTIFVIYRICSYLFFDNRKNLFDSTNIKFVIYLLIGFTIYYMIIKPIIPVNMEHPIIKNITNDTLMFGTVLISSRLIESYLSNGNYFDTKWLKTFGCILIALASYRIVIDPFIPTENISTYVRPISDDILQYGTAMIIFHFLYYQKIPDEKHILSMLFVLTGYTGYHIITKQIIKFS